MERRRLLTALALPGLLAACASDPAFNYLGGFGISVRGVALNAPFQFGDLSRWNGQPDRAALAVVQIEYLADTLANDSYWNQQVSPLVTMQMQRARDEERQALGIAQGAEPQQVMNLLRHVAQLLQAGQRDAAIEVLSGPAFSLGGEGTLRALSTLPRLPRCAEAAGAINAEINRLDNQRNR